MDRQLTPKEKRIIQEIELEILEEFDRLAKELKIDYFITAGTLLGAVRHKGFIPWDDDIDLVMTTKDYKKLSKHANHQLSTGFFFQDERSEKSYPFAFGKIRKDGTEVREKLLDSFSIHKGAYIDIFPLDKCPKNEFLAKTLFKFTWFYTSVLISKGNAAFECKYKKPTAKIAFNIAKRLPVKLIKWLRRATKNLFSLSSSGKRLCTLAGTHGYPRETYEARWFGESVMLDFEGRKYPAPKEWHSLLTSMYGDYMTPPPKNERKGHFIKSEKDAL